MFYFAFTQWSAKSVKENLIKLIKQYDLNIKILTIDNESENYRKYKRYLSLLSIFFGRKRKY